MDADTVLSADKNPNILYTVTIPKIPKISPDAS